jgi:hypothetical protein
MAQWNPRFTAYARAHGREPDEQIKHDNGMMHEYMIWNGKMIREWGGGRRLITPEDHDEYDAWLKKRVERGSP